MTITRGHVGVAVLLWAVAGTQALQAFYFLVMGLGWGGVLYSANVIQGVVLFIVACFLAAGRHLIGLLVPVLSFVICLGLQFADERLTTRACSPAAKAAIAELRLPNVIDDGDPDTFLLAFPNGCSTYYGGASESDQVALQKVRQAGRTAGWEVTSDEAKDGFEMSNERWTIEARPDQDGLIELIVRPRR